MRWLRDQTQQNGMCAGTARLDLTVAALEPFVETYSNIHQMGF